MLLYHVHVYVDTAPVSTCVNVSTRACDIQHIPCTLHIYLINVYFRKAVNTSFSAILAIEVDAVRKVLLEWGSIEQYYVYLWCLQYRTSVPCKYAELRTISCFS